MSDVSQRTRCGADRDVGPDEGDQREQRANDEAADHDADEQRDGNQRHPVVHPVGQGSFENRRPAEPGLLQAVQVHLGQERPANRKRQDRRERVEEVGLVNRPEDEVTLDALFARPVLGALTERLLFVHGGLVEEAVRVAPERAPLAVRGFRLADHTEQQDCRDQDEPSPEEADAIGGPGEARER